MSPVSSDLAIALAAVPGRALVSALPGWLGAATRWQAGPVATDPKQPDPDRFDPDRFDADRDNLTLPDLLGKAGTYEDERNPLVWLAGLLAVLAFLGLIAYVIGNLSPA